MAFYLIGSYINSIDDSTMQQLNAMSDPAANIYQESLIKGFFNCGIELIPYQRSYTLNIAYFISPGVHYIQMYQSSLGLILKISSNAISFFINH